MLYIVSGASRSGKSIASRLFMEKHGIPYLSLDCLVMGFTNGFPTCGINANQPAQEISEKLWPFLKAICINLIEIGLDYLIEGEPLLPSQIKELIEKYPNDIKVCFIGYSEKNFEDKVSEIKRFSGGINNWLSTNTDDYIHTHIEKMFKYSKVLKNECNKFGTRYFDTSEKFEERINELVDYLKS